MSRLYQLFAAPIQMPVTKDMKQETNMVPRRPMNFWKEVISLRGKYRQQQINRCQGTWFSAAVGNVDSSVHYGKGAARLSYTAERVVCGDRASRV